MGKVNDMHFKAHTFIKGADLQTSDEVRKGTVTKGADLQTSDEVCQRTFLVLLKFFVV